MTFSDDAQPPSLDIIANYDCPVCGAVPGEPCIVLDGNGVQTRTPAVTHAERGRGSGSEGG
jgi:hypothetical protein